MSRQTVTEAASITPESVSQLVLDNGLSVVWQEDHRQPLVAIEVRILGGLRGEGAFLGTGITHFLEHMLFKGTTSRPPGLIDQEVRRYGGTINAFTSHDYTGVNLFVESKFLREALSMLADILQHATFPPEEFAKERTVVISEIQMNRDDPERRIHHLFWGRHFLLHPYRHPILGYQPLLERLTVEDMRTFYAAQYIPNNVVISCVGDLDASAFPALLREVFGSWPRGAPYVPHVPAEPPAVSMKQVDEELNVQAAYAMIGFPSVRLSDPDLYPLDVLANIVGQGHSARLYEQLVRTRHLAHAVGAGNYTPFDPGVLTVALRTDPKQVAPALDAVFEVLESVKEHGVTPEELKKAKRQAVAGYVFQRQTIESKAGDLASSLALTGDPTFSSRYVEGIEGVTEEQVQQAAKRYLDRRYATLAVIHPPAPRATESLSSSEMPLQPRKVVLPNGLTVVTGVDRHLPMAVIVAGCRGGVRVETEATQGLSNLVAQMLVKGTSRKSATEIATLVESLGGVLEPFSGRDGFGLSLQLLAEDLDLGLALVHELLSDSTMPSDELELQRQLVLKELDARDDDIFDVAGRRLRATLFLSHPYRFDPLGGRASVSRLTQQECLAFAKQRLTPKNLVLAVFGDIQDARVLSDIQQRFGKLPAASSSWPDTLAAEPLDQIRRATVTLPKEQTVVMLGFRGTQVNADDRDRLEVLTAILSGMSGRLFQTVREQEGLAYTLGAFNVAGWDPGYLVVYAATRPEARERVVAMLQDQLQVLIKQGVTQEELDQAKRYLIGSHRLELQHLSGMARRSALDELYGLGYDAWTQDERRINAVTASMVQEAAARYLTLSQRAEVLVGPETAPLNGRATPVPPTRRQKARAASKSRQPVSRPKP